MLKWIAVFLMIIDHFAIVIQDYISYDFYYILRGIGRLCFPLFVYAIVKGVQRTSNFKSYLIHLLGFGIITEVIRKSFDVFNFDEFNVMISFFLYVMMYFILIDKIKLPTLIKILSMTSIVLLSSVIEYGLGGLVLFWVLMYIDKKGGNATALQLSSFIGILLSFKLTGHNSLQLLSAFAAFLMFIPKLEGRVFSPKVEKYSFYVIYPLQFLILGLISEHVL